MIIFGFKYKRRIRTENSAWLRLESEHCDIDAQDQTFVDISNMVNDATVGINDATMRTPVSLQTGSLIKHGSLSFRFTMSDYHHADGSWQYTLYGTTIREGRLMLELSQCVIGTKVGEIFLTDFYLIVRASSKKALDTIPMLIKLTL